MPSSTPAVDTAVYDFRLGAIPAWVRDAIETQLAIEREDARSAGMLGFMARALVIATMPYKDPKADVFRRDNGNFRLRIVAGYEGGIPYGTYPRLLMNWLTTEAVRAKSPEIQLGDSLSEFIREVLELRTITGGRSGSGTRVVEQMKRLFGSLITASYTDDSHAFNNSASRTRGFVLRNVLIADELALADETGAGLWKPQRLDEAGRWKSTVRLNRTFYDEIIDRPVPIDLRAYRTLRCSPLAMDLYTWFTYRMSYLRKTSHPIPWEGLMGQFGSGHASALSNADSQKRDQAIRDFKKAFLRALKMVQVVYPQIRVEPTDRGLILKPSPTHVPLSADMPLQGRLL